MLRPCVERTLKTQNKLKQTLNFNTFVSNLLEFCISWN